MELLGGLGPLFNPQVIIGALAAVLFVGAGYFFISLDRTRANSVTKDDTQAGLKLVLFGLVIAGISVVSGGAINLLSYVFGGFKGGSGPIRQAMPTIIVGALVVLVVLKTLLPRTNWEKEKQPERYALGMLGIVFGVQAIFGFHGVLSGLFLSAPWSFTSSQVAMTAVTGAIMFLAVSRFGGLAGWTQPPPTQRPMQYPPQQPPQGGGYPPPGGGYPPQGGGYPPPGGGYPPQGGGYPPQGGGGYQPR
jgi:hypothetical protein